MKCPGCAFPESKVIDSRPTVEGNSIRRRRECLSCQKRFTTFETIETSPIIVIKKNGGKELFDKQKLLAGVLKATQKRPVDAVMLVNEVESELQNTLRQEVSSMELGEMVMHKLKERDEVAYVRFASVYREFKDIESFMNDGRSSKCYRMAMGIGVGEGTNEYRVLEKFISAEERVYSADDASNIRKFFKYVTMSVTSRTRSQNPNIVPKKEEIDDEDEIF